MTDFPDALGLRLSVSIATPQPDRSEPQIDSNGSQCVERRFGTGSLAHLGPTVSLSAVPPLFRPRAVAASSAPHDQLGELQDRIRQAEERALPTDARGLVTHLTELREVYRLAQRFLRSHPDVTGRAALQSRV